MPGQLWALAFCSSGWYSSRTVFKLVLQVLLARVPPPHVPCTAVASLTLALAPS